MSQSFLSLAQEAHDIPDSPAQGWEMTNLDSEANYDMLDSESSANKQLFNNSNRTNNTNDTNLKACSATLSKLA